MSNPLYTPDQAATEKLALTLIERADVRAAREEARNQMRCDPAASVPDGALSLDRALDQWVLALAMRKANGDPAAPMVVWNVSNPPRHWFGHSYGGAAVAVDNPDNFNREIPVDGSGHYEIEIGFSDNPPQFSVVIEMEPAHHAGLGRNIGALTLQQLLPHCDADRRVTVTVGPDPGGPLHLQSEPGRIQIYTRDSQADWNQRPAEVTVRRLDPPADWQPRSEADIAAAIIADMPAWVRFWRGFKDSFLGFPAPNQLIGPNGRDGNWGYLAGGRFAVADDEAVLVTLDPVGSYYTGFQITDPWTIAPDPMHRLASLNTSQVTNTPDGTVTYAIALVDPGLANWIDTCGLHEGWMLTRWQGVPGEPQLERMIREVSLVKLADIPHDIPRIDLDGRRRQNATRAQAFAQRTNPEGWRNSGVSLDV
ncbi:hypothetical protein [Novosphingobium sp. AAP93]|uniref:hypothetical protein n=1 Tax=Novosphingobium sp. AAP93 TaxID=1523427 RepID=UPI0006B971DD|nr:hypothetical protein [Novosphingobium sp. AAP93]KPF84102.1 hypothetical protein IP83_09640 [Novosphingobium sp. AAP93]